MQKDILIYPYLTQFAGGPYYQQLTREAYLDKTPGYERVDQQIISAICSIREKLFIEDHILTEEKIDVLGFSAAGTFAQRFTLLHYEMVRACCSGGAMDGVILPLEELEGERLEYPMGIADYEEITGRKYDREEHKKVIYYNWYGAKEKEKILYQNGEPVRDEEGNVVSYYDKAYLRRCTPPEDAAQMLRLIGKTPEERFKKYEDIYKKLGFDYITRVYPDVGHMNTSETNKGIQDFFQYVSDKERAYKLPTKLEQLEAEQRKLTQMVGEKEAQYNQLKNQTKEKDSYEQRES